MNYKIVFCIMSLFVGSAQCMNRKRKHTSSDQKTLKMPPAKRILFQESSSENSLAASQEEDNTYYAQYTVDNSDIESQIRKSNAVFDEQKSILTDFYIKALELDTYDIQEKEEFAKDLIAFAKRNAANQLGALANELKQLIVAQFHEKELLNHSNKRSIALKKLPQLQKMI